jgi:hypothetical protein
MLGRMKEAIGGITPSIGSEYGAEKMDQELLDSRRSRIESFT